MNVAFLAQVYSQYIKSGGGSAAKRAKRYSCWSQTQAGSMSLQAHHTLLSTCALTLEHCFIFSFSYAIVDSCCDCLFARVGDCAFCGLSPINLDVQLLAT